MFESISRGWSLTKTSFKVLKLDKEILALPLISGVLLLIVTASFLVPLATVFANTESPLMWAYVFAFYLVTYFVILWFNAAVVEMATIRFNGGDPILKDGLRKAWEKKGRIFQWAMVAATVGLLLKVLDSLARQSDNQMMRLVGQIGVALAGAAWNIATFFVMPVLIYQDLGPFDAIRTSVGTWKRTWGEGFTAIFSTGILFFLAGLLGLLPIFAGVAIGSPGALMAGVAVAVVYWVLLWCANTAVDGIIVAALYKYAVDGRLPEAFAGAPIPGAPTMSPSMRRYA